MLAEGNDWQAAFDTWLGPFLAPSATRRAADAADWRENLERWLEPFINYAAAAVCEQSRPCPDTLVPPEWTLARE